MPLLPLEPIRQAVSSGDFDGAQLLWNECAAALNEDLKNGSLTEARLAEVRALVEWSGTVVLCERTRMRGELNSLHVAGEYELGVPPSPHRLVSTSF
jgi:hypothetical protein